MVLFLLQNKTMIKKAKHKDTIKIQIIEQSRRQVSGKTPAETFIGG